MDKERVFDLEDRLITYAVRIIALSEALPKTVVGNHVRGQLARSGTSPASNYGEAQSAESRQDFVHKIKIVLKELRETRIWLKIIVRADLIRPASAVDPLLLETEELTAIFSKSAKTAARNRG